MEWILTTCDWRNEKQKHLTQKKIENGFGKSNNQHTQVGQIWDLVSGMYDVLNQYYLDIEIEHISISENELAKTKIWVIWKKMKLKQTMLIIFDRGTHP